MWFHFAYKLPPSNDHGMLRAQLSGVDVVTILSGMKRTSLPLPGGWARNRAVARRIYDAIAEVVDQIDAAAKDGTPVPPIVIDDKIRED